MANGVRRLADRVSAALDRRRPPTGPRPSRRARRGAGRRARIEVGYRPVADGHPDPGEVVWAWIPFEEDPRQGKDRPVVIVGQAGDRLAGVMLTSKPHPEDHDQVPVGTGPWDRERRASYARLDRIVGLTAAQVRREGSRLDRARFDQLVAALALRRGWPEVDLEVVGDDAR